MRPASDLRHLVPGTTIIPAMIKNIIFDAGGVLLEWNPPRVIAQLYPDPQVQAQIREFIFEHPDWHEFDRGTITLESAGAHFSRLSGRSPDEVRELIRATAESLRPIDGTIPDSGTTGGGRYPSLSALQHANEHLRDPQQAPRLLRALQAHGDLGRHPHAQARGSHLPAPVEVTGIIPAESVFIDDLTRNVVAARESGLNAIQFASPEQCRAELRTYLPNIGL